MGFRPSSHTGSQWSDTEKKSSASDERGNFHTQKKTISYSKNRQ